MADDAPAIRKSQVIISHYIDGDLYSNKIINIEKICTNSFLKFLW